MQYTEIFFVVKMKISSEKNDIFLIFAQNIDFGYTFEYPQSIFWSKNTKNRYTLAYPIFALKSGIQGGMHYTDTFSWC